LNYFRYKSRPLSECFSPKKILIALWLFLLVFPKGGFKIGDAPITWGYMLLSLLSLALIIRGNFRIHPPRLQAWFLLMPFQAMFCLSWILHGSPPVTMGIAFFISFFFLPTIFFCLLSETIEKINLPYLLKLIKNGILFVSCFGIFLFLFKATTGKTIEIPFITINYHDIGTIEFKCNNRGFVFKLISTYNNGNLYGISLLILLSLYCYIEKRTWAQQILKLSLILTFSRTVWIGLVFNQILHNCLVAKHTVNTIIKFCLKSAIFVAFFVGIIAYVGIPATFFMDNNLGGRVHQLKVLESTTFFPDQPFELFGEIVYLSVLEQFGLLGLFAYLLAMISPIFLAFMYRRQMNPLRKSLICGLMTYLFISASDGAILLIPVLVFYWFYASLVLRQDLDISNERGLQKRHF
jgi:hypothetical protein